MRVIYTVALFRNVHIAHLFAKNALVYPVIDTIALLIARVHDFVYNCSVTRLKATEVGVAGVGRELQEKLAECRNGRKGTGAGRYWNLAAS